MAQLRVRKSFGFVLMFAGALATAWVISSAIGFLSVSPAQWVFGDFKGWVALLWLIAILINGVALGALGYRAARRPPAGRHPNRTLVCDAGWAICFIMMGFGGWIGLVALVPLFIFAVMMITSRGDRDGMDPVGT